MPLIYHDLFFQYKGENGFDGVCDLRVYKGAKFESSTEPIIVIASEIYTVTGASANNGVSVTNAIEVIGTKVHTELGFVFSFLFEHYPDRGHNLDKLRERNRPPQIEETFDRVTFRWLENNRYREPKWAHVERSYVEEIIGEPFRDIYVK